MIYSKNARRSAIRIFHYFKFKEPKNTELDIKEGYNTSTQEDSLRKDEVEDSNINVYICHYYNQFWFSADSLLKLLPDRLYLDPVFVEEGSSSTETPPAYHSYARNKIAEKCFAFIPLRMRKLFPSSRSSTGSSIFCLSLDGLQYFLNATKSYYKVRAFQEWLLDEIIPELDREFEYTKSNIWQSLLNKSSVDEYIEELQKAGPDVLADTALTLELMQRDKVLYSNIQEEEVNRDNETIYTPLVYRYAQDVLVRVVIIGEKVWFVARDITLFLCFTTKEHAALMQKLPDQNNHCMAKIYTDAQSNFWKMHLISLENVDYLISLREKDAPEECQDFLDWLHHRIAPCFGDVNYLRLDQTTTLIQGTYFKVYIKTDFDGSTWYNVNKLCENLDEIPSSSQNIDIILANLPNSNKKKMLAPVLMPTGVTEIREDWFTTEHGLFYLLGRCSHLTAISYMNWMLDKVIPILHNQNSTIQQGFEVKAEIDDEKLVMVEDSEEFLEDSFITQTFNNCQIRFSKWRSKVWFVLKDISCVLSYRNPNHLIQSYFTEDQVSKVKISTKGANGVTKVQCTYIVNLDGIENMLTKCGRPECYELHFWIYKNVLPVFQQEASRDKTDNLKARIQDLSTELQEKDDQISKLEAILKENNSKLEAILKENNSKLEEYTKSMSTSSGCITIKEFSILVIQQGITTGPNRLFAWFRKNNFLCTRGIHKNIPTQVMINLGLFEVKKSLKTVKYRSTKVHILTTMITSKGIKFFLDYFKKHNITCI